MPIPDKIREAPELRIGLELFLTAFFDLSSSRQVGMGIGGIPWAAVQDYCDRLGIVGEQAEDLHYHVAQLDIVWIDHHQSKEKS